MVKPICDVALAFLALVTWASIGMAVGIPFQMWFAMTGMAYVSGIIVRQKGW